MKKFSYGFLVVFAFLTIAQPTSAHEAYVLTHAQFQQGLLMTTANPLASLSDPQYIQVSVWIALAIIISYLASILWATTIWAAILDRLIKKAHVIGPFIIRTAISASFFYAAFANAILGPELSLTHIPGGTIIRFLLFVLSIMIFLGFLTEVAALIGLILFIYISCTFQAYMITYANYFGELIVLFLFGSRFFSIDLLLFGKRAWFPFFEKRRFLETPIVRILYGIALMYAGWTIKFVHQGLSINVYNEYHLINFFHASAAYIAAGAGLSEILIGLFIFLGFAQRLTTIISLFFITLSILYFREMLWPHFMLYGISFSIIINSADALTIDHYMVPFIRNLRLSVAKKRKGKQR